MSKYRDSSLFGRRLILKEPNQWAILLYCYVQSSVPPHRISFDQPAGLLVDTSNEPVKLVAEDMDTHIPFRTVRYYFNKDAVEWTDSVEQYFSLDAVTGEFTVLTDDLASLYPLIGERD